MKFILVYAALALTALAYRCRFDRYITYTPGGCRYAINGVNQTEKDAHSKRHVNSCYGRLRDITGDANCRLIVTAGGSCDESNGILAEIRCTGNELAWVPEEHSYRVVCD
ncbi:hypothetical protein F5X98DRAFT_376121 [Xylaria grammica]|nr:hypothetical protein F5X98DRAFT_376121 [Xylaria grammica]